MKDRISNKGRGKKPWMPLYTADLITDRAVCRCSFETRGVWVWMLCAAWKEEVRGTLPGDMDELAGVTLVPIQILTNAVKELGIHGVFSRGRDDEFVGHDLPPDAIVNRRMYGEWRLEQMKIKAGRKGGKKSAEMRRQNADDSRNIGIERFPSRGPTEAQAESKQKASTARAHKPTIINGIQTGAPSTPPNRDPSTPRSTPLFESSDKSRKCNNAEAFRSNPRGGLPGEPVPISSVPISDALGDFQSTPLLARIAAVTGEQDPRWMSWFEAALEVMERFGGYNAALDIITRAEESADLIIRKVKGFGVLKHPGKFLVAKFLEWGRETRNTMPETPAAKGKS